jgi:PAS domain S-box-containing protein
MWRAAVSSSLLTIGLVDLSTTCFLELSPRAAALLGTTPEGGVGLDYLSVADRPRDAAETFRLVREGMLDGIRGRRWFRRSDGSTMEIESSGWAIRTQTGPDLGLWVARDAPTRTDHATVTDEVTATHPPAAGLDLVGAWVTLDDHWRIDHVGTNAGSLLGRPPAELRGASIIDLTHPDDLAALLLGFARATTESGAGVRVRLRHRDEGWRASQAVPTVLDDDDIWLFGLDLAIDEDGEAMGSQLGKLAGHLRRIAAQLESAGVLVESADSLGLPLMTELSARQWEVVSRLVRGERVSTIAAEMYLSQSTVRNHLSAIFRKAGVHSQQELLALWRGGRVLDR